ncbi:uncharacterized protein LOC121384683 [Gigantopelta aegis]|uniref:uncharacterized protein LOC121384683 n=1 Tax=Gigantopelta aegis TaxID=1735272 RepID=UPI001B88B6EE|nr:uncharacterized protein LOC121384683 [Gigantopelta aegis]XP_041371117.1 uncharacterized protein LOC121384683 [Gigantopelta aegis]
MMGNEQSEVHNKWLTCIPKIIREFSISESNVSSNAYIMDSDTDSDSDDVCSEQSQLLETAVVDNDREKLLEALHDTNPNLPLNEKKENALIVAIKLSHLEMVNILLSTDHCNKDFINIHDCSALDIALITAFDNSIEPRHSVCWQIVSLLFDHHAEPSCKDAMMYIIRTAFKFEHASFIHRLIQTLIEHASSYRIHETLLEKLHRHQPMLTNSIDPFLEHASAFSIKLIKLHNRNILPLVMSAFVYYIESHWDSKQIRARVFMQLVVYATVAGWHWSSKEVLHISKVCEDLAQWCRCWPSRPASLCHLSRVVIRSTTPLSMTDTLRGLSLPETVKDYIMLKDVDNLFSKNDWRIESVLF